MVVAVEPVDAAHWRVQLAAGSAIDAFAAAVVARGFGLLSLTADATSLESTFLAIAASDAREVAA
jgi:ABC-2 type transport system ATP-binding protein